MATANRIFSFVKQMIEQHKQPTLLVAGYIRQEQKALNLPVPDLVTMVVLMIFYGECCTQTLILKSDELKSKSLQLLIKDGCKMLKHVRSTFIPKQLRRLWCGKISESKGSKLDLVLFYMLWSYVKNEGGKSKFDPKTLKYSIQHLRTWLIVKHGHKRCDDSYEWEITYNHVTNSLFNDLIAYIEAKGNSSMHVNIARDPNAVSIGICWKYDVKKGFGFISADGNDDIFVHYSEIKANGFKKLEIGQRVEFEIVTTIKGRRKAINVSAPNDSDIVYDQYRMPVDTSLDLILKSIVNEIKFTLD
eukprot:180140_1